MQLFPSEYSYSSRPAWCHVGAVIYAEPPTVRARLDGEIVEISDKTVTLAVTDELLIAVHLDDCRPGSR